jgi:hypothetical protein
MPRLSPAKNAVDPGIGPGIRACRPLRKTQVCRRFNSERINPHCGIEGAPNHQPPAEADRARGERVRT